MKCRDHGREPCTVPRCQVLALCRASMPQFEGDAHDVIAHWWAWMGDHGYPQDAPSTTDAQIADRLVAWMRWRGERRAGACARSRFTATHMLSVRPGIDDHWEDHGPGFSHPLNECRPYRDRIRALSSTCPRADCWARPSDDWATVLVLLDWLTDRGWTLQEVHEWRLRASMAGSLHRLAGAFAMPAAALNGAYDGAAAIDEEWRRIAVLLSGPASLLDAVRAGIHAQALKSHHSLLEIYRHAAEEIAAHGEPAAIWWASQREVVTRPDVRSV